MKRNEQEHKSRKREQIEEIQKIFNETKELNENNKKTLEEVNFLFEKESQICFLK